MANVSEALYDWSNTGGSNQPDSGDQATVQADLQAIQAGVRGWLAHKGSDIASVAGTTDIGAVEGKTHTITGTEAITGFGTVSAGIEKNLIFAAAATLTHNATSLILPGAANITTAAGDVAHVVSLGSGNWRCLQYTRANGAPVGWKIYTELATTSGTTKDFTIDPWANEIVITGEGVSTDGTEELIIQIGDSGGVHTTGYVGAVETGSGSATVNMSSGFLLQTAGVAASVNHFKATLHRMNAAGTKWSFESRTHRSDSAATGWNSNGTVSLDTVITTVRLTTTNTPDDFDAGSVGCMARA